MCVCLQESGEVSLYSAQDIVSQSLVVVTPGDEQGEGGGWGIHHHTHTCPHQHYLPTLALLPLLTHTLVMKEPVQDTDRARSQHAI